MLQETSLSVGRALVPVTPADTPQEQSYRALYVGTAGTVVAQGRNGVVVTFPDVAAGATLIGEFTHIMLATTAGALVGYV